MAEAKTAPFTVVWGPGSGLSAHVIRSGIDRSTNWRFIDLHVKGVGADRGNFYFERASDLALAKNNQTWATSVAIGLVAGMAPAMRAGIYFYDEDRMYLRESGSGQADFDFIPRDVSVHSLADRRLEWITETQNARVRFARQHVWVSGIEPGTHYDFVIRVADPRLEIIKSGNCPLPYLPTEAGEAAVCEVSVALRQPPALEYSLVPESDVDRIIEAHLQTPVLPLKVYSNEKLRLLRLDGSEGPSFVPFVTSDRILRVHLWRCAFPYAANAPHTMARLFDLCPSCEEVAISGCLDSLENIPNSSRKIDRQTFILDLPDTVDDYRTKVLSYKFRRDLGRYERRLSELISGYELKIVRGESLTLELFQSTVRLVSARLKEKTLAEGHMEWTDPHPLSWINEQYPVFKSKGFSVLIQSNSKLVASGITGWTGYDYHFTLFGFDPYYSYNGKYSIGSLLVYKLIESIILNGGRRIHFGGGDFGYKSRFGAVERPLFNINIRRNCSEP